MSLEDIARKMEREFEIEDDFGSDTVHEFPVKDGQGYYIDRGPIEFARGQIEAYVYIEYADGEIVSHRCDTPKELELWTKYLD